MSELELDRLHVLYDISTLAIGHHRRRAKTGIYRVVENVGRRLAESPEVDLSLTATLSLQTYKETCDYLQDTQNFAGRQLILPFTQTVGVRLGLSAGSFVDRVAVRKKTRRVSRFLAWRFVQALAAPQIDLSINAGRPFDIVHSPFAPLPAASRGWGAARFITIYDMLPVLMPDHFPAGMRRLFSRILQSVQPDDWVLCISEATKRDFCTVTGFDPARVTVTPLGCDTAVFFPEVDSDRLEAVRRRYGIPDGPYILCLNTQEPRKNIAGIVQAFSTLAAARRVPGTSLVLAGGAGWQQGAITASIAAARRTAPDNAIIETDFVVDSDLAALYSGARMFVFVPLYEGFGLPALEAMTCGVPVITSNTSSLPEVVGDAALTVDPTNIVDIAGAISRVFDNPELRSDLAGRSLVRSRQFSWDRCVTQTIAAYCRAYAAR